jgi:hypothetical protein
MQYPTSWTVAGSIPYEVIEFFNLCNLSGRTMTLGSIQPLTEMSTRNLSGGKARQELKGTTSPPPIEPIVYKM